MTRLFLIAVALAALPLEPRVPRRRRSASTSGRWPAPKPALKYQLLPELGELNPGNAAQDYLKCFMEQRIFFYSKQAVADRARYQTMPLAELRTEKLHDYGGNALRQADWAARLDTLDWQALRAHPGRRHGRAAGRAGTAPAPGGVAPGPVPVRGGRAALRRRDPHGQDDVRAGPPPGRAPHGGRRPGRAVGRASRPRHAGRDGAAAGLPQPLLGADRPALPPGRPAQGRAGRTDPGRGGPPAAPRRRPHDGRRAGRVRGPTLRHAEFRPRTGGPRASKPADPAASQDQGRGPSRRRPPPPGGGGSCAGPGPEAPGRAGHPAGREARLRDPPRRSHQAPRPAHLADRIPGGLRRSGRRTRTGCSPTSCRRSSSSAGRRRNWNSRSPCSGTSRPCACTPRSTTASCPARLSDISVPLPVDPANGKPFVYAVEGTTAHIRGGSLRGKEPEPGCGVHYEVTLLK